MEVISSITTHNQELFVPAEVLIIGGVVITTVAFAALRLPTQRNLRESVPTEGVRYWSFDLERGGASISLLERALSREQS
ncbi:MAG: hypothetical protein V4489_05160 [Chlamydiota bacterium]